MKVPSSLVLLAEDLTLSQISNSPVSTQIKNFADERNGIQGNTLDNTKFVSSIYTKRDDLAIFKLITDATRKYGDNYEYKAVDSKTRGLVKNPFESYEIWIGFYPVQQTMEEKGFPLTKEGIINAFKSCFVKIWSNSPSFQYQGFNYNLSQKSAAFYPTTKPPRVWSLKNDGTYLDKHLYAVFAYMPYYLDLFAEDLLKKVPREAAPVKEVAPEEGQPSMPESTKNQIWVELQDDAVKYYLNNDENYLFEITPDDVRRHDIGSLLNELVQTGTIERSLAFELKPHLVEAVKLGFDALTNPDKYQEANDEENIGEEHAFDAEDRGEEKLEDKPAKKGFNGGKEKPGDEEPIEKEPPKEKRWLVYLFGRFNPPTRGHLRAFKYLCDIAKKHNALPAHIISTSSQGSSKDPLPPNVKRKFIDKMIKLANLGKELHVVEPTTFFPGESDIVQFVPIISRFYKRGIKENKPYTNVIIFQEAAKALDTVAKKWNGKGSEDPQDPEYNPDYFKFESIQVLSTPGRKEKLEVEETPEGSVEVNPVSVSATEARKAAIENNRELFNAIVIGSENPEDRNMWEQYADDLFNELQHYLGIYSGVGGNLNSAIREELISYLIEDLDMTREVLDTFLEEVPTERLIEAYETFGEQTLSEGGHAVPDVESIDRSSVGPTIKAFAQVLSGLQIDSSRLEPIGSTGKKAVNGDIDVALNTNLDILSLNEILVEGGLITAPNKGFNQISVQFPQYGEGGISLDKNVQIDIMLGPLDWMRFRYVGFDESVKFGPLGRLAALAALLKYANDVDSYGINTREVFSRSSKGTKIQNPDEIARIISVNSSEMWTPQELEQPLNIMWSLIAERFPVEKQETIANYIQEFLTSNNIQGWIPPSRGEGLTEASHLTHLEDLIYDRGLPGASETLAYIDKLISQTEGIKTTVKIDGSPSVIVASSYPGVDAPFIGSKMALSTVRPQIFRTKEEIVAQYPDNPQLVDKFNSLLKHLPRLGIPPGELWKGDLLFSPADKELNRRKITVDAEGKSWIEFTPNTVTYRVKADSDVGRAIWGAEVGVAFHTIYSGTDLKLAEPTARYGSVDVSQLTPPQEVFVMDANIPVTGPSDDSDQLLLLRTELDTELAGCGSLVGKYPPAFKPLLNKFENDQIRAGAQFGDVPKYIDDFKQWLESKPNAQKKIEMIDQHYDEFVHLFTFQKLVVEIKNILLKKLNATPLSLQAGQGVEGQFVQGNHEGFVVSDASEEAIKLVDRPDFSRRNLLRHDEQTNRIQERMSVDTLKTAIVQNVQKVSDPIILQKTYNVLAGSTLSPYFKEQLVLKFPSATLLGLVESELLRVSQSIDPVTWTKILNAMFTKGLLPASLQKGRVENYEDLLRAKIGEIRGIGAEEAQQVGDELLKLVKYKTDLKPALGDGEIFFALMLPGGGKRSVGDLDLNGVEIEIKAQMARLKGDSKQGGFTSGTTIARSCLAVIDKYAKKYRLALRPTLSSLAVAADGIPLFMNDAKAAKLLSDPAFRSEYVEAMNTVYASPETCDRAIRKYTPRLEKALEIAFKDPGAFWRTWVSSNFEAYKEASGWQGMILINTGPSIMSYIETVNDLWALEGSSNLKITNFLLTDSSRSGVQLLLK